MVLGAGGSVLVGLDWCSVPQRGGAGLSAEHSGGTSLKDADPGVYRWVWSVPVGVVGTGGCGLYRWVWSWVRGWGCV